MALESHGRDQYLPATDGNELALRDPDHTSGAEAGIPERRRLKFIGCRLAIFASFAISGRIIGAIKVDQTYE